MLTLDHIPIHRWDLDNPVHRRISNFLWCNDQRHIGICQLNIDALHKRLRHFRLRNLKKNAQKIRKIATCQITKSKRQLKGLNGILLPKLFWTTVRKNCSSDREKLLKFKAEGWEFAKCLRSRVQFVQRVKGQNNFWNIILFTYFGRFLRSNTLEQLDFKLEKIIVI